MPRKMTQKEFEDRVSKFGLVEVIGKYTGGHNSVKCRCLTCNKEWDASAGSVSSGGGCPECGAKKSIEKRRTTHESFVSMMAEKNPDVEVVGMYYNSSTKIGVKCKICGCNWEQTPNNLTSKLSGCPECRYKKVALKLKKKRDDFVVELANIHPTIELLGEYISNDTKTEFKCLNCGYEWLGRPHDIVNGQQCGCPRCRTSKGENAIENYLNENKIAFESQKGFQNCKHKRALKFDFYLPDYNLCIEFQGAQHYRAVDYFGGVESFEESQKRDNIKRDFCRLNGISLLEIPYTQMDEIPIILNQRIQGGVRVG